MTAELDTAAPTRSAETAEPTARRPSRHAWIREVAIVVGFYYVYNAIRSLADVGDAKNRAYRNANWIVSAEKAMFLYHEQPIQEAFLGAHWFIKVMNVYYGTLHFAITAGLLVWLFVRRHSAYREMRNLIGATTGLALVGYWSFPLAPPRLYLSCEGNIPVLGAEGGLVKPACFVDTLEQVGGLWDYQSSVAKTIANSYAAMPSLHFGWSLWCAIVMWRCIGGRFGRSAAVMYPSVTLFAIVVTANHFILDAVGGAIIVLCGIGVVRWSGERRSARRTLSASTQLSAS